MAYDGDRLPPPSDARDAIDQLETILREVAEELAGWRSRAQKAESELKSRVHDLMQRLSFLEEQARDNGGHK